MNYPHFQLQLFHCLYPPVSPSPPPNHSCLSAAMNTWVLLGKTVPVLTRHSESMSRLTYLGIQNKALSSHRTFPLLSIPLLQLFIGLASSHLQDSAEVFLKESSPDHLTLSFMSLPWFIGNVPVPPFKLPSAFFFLVNLFFNWRIIALQNFVVFCQTSTWVSHRYTYITSLLNLPSISLPIPPL